MVLSGKYQIYRVLTEIEFRKKLYKQFTFEYQQTHDMFKDINQDDFIPFMKLFGVGEFEKNVQNIYVITQSVTQNLNSLIINKGNENWDVFEGVKNGVYSLIIANNLMLKIIKENEEMLWLLSQHEEPEIIDEEVFDGIKRTTNYSHTSCISSYNFKTRKCFDLIDRKPIINKNIANLYSLFCFFFLAENNEVILKPNSKIGNRKEGKICNRLPLDVIIVNSRWNSDVVREEAFGVRGHFALRRFGVGRRLVRLVFISPFIKNGYKRLSGKKLNSIK